MAVREQVIGDRYALYNGDCIEVMQGLPDRSIHHSIYSPPFGGLYQYSSSDRDLSNCLDLEGFLEHYRFVVRELARITLPGRISCVHCAEVPTGNTGLDDLEDLPGDIIRLHKEEGWKYCGRRAIWKEPLAVRLRTMQKNLAHFALCEDSTASGIASADYLLVFRNAGKNPIPVAHPVGLTEYEGERTPPKEVIPFRGYEGKQIHNKYSQWVWRQYADCMWDDIHSGRVLPFKPARDPEDERHVHPLQLDVIGRSVTLFTNVGETVFTPFMGVGSEVYAPVLMGRYGVGVELKPSYFRQAVKNVKAAAEGCKVEAPESGPTLFDMAEGLD